MGTINIERHLINKMYENKMKKIFLITIILIAQNLNAEESINKYFFWSNNKKVYLRLDSSQIVLHPNKKIKSEQYAMELSKKEGLVTSIIG